MTVTAGAGREDIAARRTVKTAGSGIFKEMGALGVSGNDLRLACKWVWSAGAIIRAEAEFRE